MHPVITNNAISLNIMQNKKLKHRGATYLLPLQFRLKGKRNNLYSGKYRGVINNIKQIVVSPESLKASNKVLKWRGSSYVRKRRILSQVKPIIKSKIQA